MANWDAPKSCGPFPERPSLRTHRVGLVDEQLNPLPALEGTEVSVPLSQRKTLRARTATHAEDLIEVLDHNTLRASESAPILLLPIPANAP